MEEPLTIGDDIVRVRVRAGVCLFCGERLFDHVANDVIDGVISQVREGNIKQLVHVGDVYRVK